MNKKGFTFVEIMIVVAIIAILASAVLVSVEKSRTKAKINGVKISVKGTLPAIVACKDGGGTVNTPVGSEPGSSKSICNPATAGLNGASWPELSGGYTYGTIAGPPASSYDFFNCNFRVFTSGDVTPLGLNYLTCNCITQNCD